MKIAYGTYAMPTVPLEEALTMISEIGYEGVELAIGPRNNSMPEQISPAKRRQLRRMLSELDLGVPALFVLKSVFTEDAKVHAENLGSVRKVVDLARDLEIGPSPVISMGIGGKSELWESQRNHLVQLLRDYAELATSERFVLAVEPHVNAAVDRTDRAIWLMNAVDSQQVRLHFDIVHFYLAGEPIEETVHRLVPYTAHTHVTDARKRGERFELVLLGQGELGLAEYVKAMHRAGWKDFVTVEVSVMVWSREDYDPFAAASFSYATIDRAFKEAEIPRP